MARSTIRFACFIFLAVHAAFAIPQQNPTPSATPKAVSAPSSAASPSASQSVVASPSLAATTNSSASQSTAASASASGSAKGNSTGGHGGGDSTPRPGAPRGVNFLGKPNPIFFYDPDFSIAVGSVAVFFISFSLHAMAVYFLKTWYFIILAQAPLINVVAAIARVHSVLNPGAMTPYVIQTMFWSIPVSIVGIGLIFTSTRFIWWVTPSDRLNWGTLLLPHHHLSAIWGMLFAFPDIAKAVAAQMGKPKGEHKYPNSTDIYHRIEATATSFQFVFFGLFSLWFIRFLNTSKNFPVPVEILSRPWRRFGFIIAAANVLLTWRVLWSTIEFDARYDPNSFVSKHEWTFWAFNALPLLLIYTLFNYEHPGLYFPRDLTRFQLNTKNYEKKKLEDARAASITNNISSSPQDDKTVEVITHEIAPNSEGRHRH